MVSRSRVQPSPLGEESRTRERGGNRAYFALISDKIKNATYRSSNHKFSQSLERKFRSIVSSCLRYGLCQEFVHSSVISPATWIFSAATCIDLSTIILPGKEMSYAALFINNSDLLFAKQFLQSANEK